MNYIDTENGKMFLEIAYRRPCDIFIPDGDVTGSPHAPAEAVTKNLANAAVQIAFGTTPDDVTRHMITTRCISSRNQGRTEAAAFEQGISQLGDFIRYIVTPVEGQGRPITQDRLDEVTERLTLFSDVFPGCAGCDHNIYRSQTR